MGVPHPTRPFLRLYSGPRSQRGPSRYLGVAQGMLRWVLSLSWGCWLVLHDLFFVSGRFRGGGKLAGSSTPNAALFTLILLPQVSKRPIKVPGGGPGNNKVGVFALFGLLVVFFYYKRASAAAPPPVTRIGTHGALYSRSAIPRRFYRN